ncbi:MAG: tRNA pseudouridine(55) synthase TruB [Dokdonella sp.]
MRKTQRRQERVQWRNLTGIVLLDKPQGLSSNAALQVVRRLFRAAKGGHTGSLDPLATGLLPICFGEATKIAGLLLGASKAYRVEAALGVETDTADAQGSITREREVGDYDAATIDAALPVFRGRIAQVPPIYSALKRDGEPLYKLARRGETVEIAAREVEVTRFELLQRRENRLELLVECGSGTYVRSLVRDLGERLGCGAHVSMLRRLWVDPFGDPAMVTLEQIEMAAREGLGALDVLVLPMSAGLVGYPSFVLAAADAGRLRQGQAINVSASPGPHLACDVGGQPLALVEVGTDGVMRCVRGFNPD